MVALVCQWHFYFSTVLSLFCKVAFLKMHVPQKPHIADCCLSPVWTLSVALGPLLHDHRCPSLSPFLFRNVSSECLGCLRNLVTWACCGVFGHRGLRCQRCQAQRVTKPTSCVQVSVPTQKKGEPRVVQLLGDWLVSVQLCMLYLGYPYTHQQASSAT